ncbi:hypothetical protein [Frankia sp. Cr2]|uniref:hypothetical protein n=1 Tax=Frankia sp. Cr2 TaxID=3073932 RepID=UPI002AD3473C|nr:hypothetical protein [Frankia sp. Cr2]
MTSSSRAEPASTHARSKKYCSSTRLSPKSSSPPPRPPPPEHELIDFSRTQIAGFKKPKQIVYLDALPKNAYGKVLRREVCTLALPTDRRPEASAKPEASAP